MILLNAIYFLPAIVAMLWIVLLCFKQKNLTQKQLLVLLFFCTYYYISYALYVSPWTDYLLMAQFDVLNLPVSMCILALNIEFVLTHKSRKFFDSRWHWLIYLPAVVYLFMSVSLYHLVGLERVAYCEELSDQGLPIPVEYMTSNFRMHKFVTSVLFNAIALVSILFTIFLCYTSTRSQGYRWGDAYRYFFKGAETTTARSLFLTDAATILMMLPIAFAGRMWMMHHPIFSAIISALTAFLLFILCYVEYYIELGRSTLYRLSHMQLSPFGPEQPPVPNRLISEPDQERDEPEPTVPVSEIPEGLPQQVRTCFEVDHVYRDTELSIITLADRLGTNRTTLSATINQVFGMSFRQLVNNYRVEAAKAFMLAHPKATQDAIAIECGFTSAQAFNLKFKAATGLAPRAWLLANHPESV